MVQLWKRMRHAYGQRWVRDYGDVKDSNGNDGDAFTTWSEVLSGVSMNQIAHGLEATLSTGGAHPPNLSEFTKACLSKRENTQDVKAYLEAPEPKKNPEGLRMLLETWREVQKQPREWPSFEDKQYAYNFLGLQTRWGPLKRTEKA